MKCEICNEEFEEQYFDINQNKCILHSEKDASYENDNFDICLHKYILRFEDKLSIELNEIFFPSYFIMNMYSVLKYTDKISFYKCNFLGKLNFTSKEVELIFNKCTFLNTWEQVNVKNEIYFNCNFNIYFSFSIEAKRIGNQQFFDCAFKTISITGGYFEKKLFHYTNENKNYNIETLHLVDCLFDKDVIFNSNREKDYADNFSIQSLSFHGSTFRGKVKIQFCEIEDADFYNTKFEDLADFYQTKFKNVNFERTDFKGISVFSETEFMCNIDFKYTKFLGKAIFRDTVITGILDLRNSIFDDEANFLDITSQKREKNKNDEFSGEIKSIQVANRETARVIKNFYDNSNNIIEANRFYALEMEEREKELEQNKTKNFMEWLVFKAHKISSNHSQDWFLSLFWIINLTFFYSSNHCVELRYESNFLFFSFLSFSSTLFLIEFLLALDFLLKNKFILVGVCLFNYILYSIFFKDYTLEFFSNQINPFSIMTGKDTLNLFTLVYKSFIAYLIYQFIVSVRQNTRRK